MIFNNARNGSSALGNAGSTLLELIAVLLIIGIIGAVVLSKTTSIDTYKLAGEKEMVKAHLRFAQTRAMNSDTNWGIYFETANTYWLFKGSTPAVAGRIRLPGEGDIVTLPTLTITGTPITVIFNTFGSPGTTAISITTLGGTITVSANTGFVS